MAKVKKHIPFLESFTIQLISFVFVLPFCQAELNIGFINNPSALIAINICFSSVFCFDLLLFVLSLTKFCNVPIAISEDGITTKDGKLHLWNGMEKIEYKYKWIIIRSTRVVITYNDGSIVIFEPNNNITRSILSLCHDSSFLQMYKDVLCL